MAGTLVHILYYSNQAGTTFSWYWCSQKRNICGLQDEQSVLGIVVSLETHLLRRWKRSELFYSLDLHIFRICDSGIDIRDPELVYWVPVVSSSFRIGIYMGSSGLALLLLELYMYPNCDCCFRTEKFLVINLYHQPKVSDSDENVWWISECCCSGWCSVNTINTRAMLCAGCQDHPLPLQ